MLAVYGSIRAVGRTCATVLIRGETGTGKELVARAVHRFSPRRERPFVKVDCGALAEGLLESELFGHVKGAFTDAGRDRAGRFELAADGTIFLDEIHNLTVPLQAKLLRVVDEGRFEKVGDTTPREVDVRIIAATNEELEPLVARGRFRKDLFYRLNVMPVTLPPLRERLSDVPLLAEEFVRRFAKRHGKAVGGVSGDALRRLTEYDWPGNVRELENAIEQAVLFARSTEIRADDLPLPKSGPAKRSTWNLNEALREYERHLLVEALSRTGGNKKRAAKLLGISRSALYEKLRKYAILLEDSADRPK
jgi:transcriptional regulator with PAS, ATPase and Fis domain